MTEDMINVLTVLVTQIFLGIYVFLLIDFKQPKYKWKLRWVVPIVIVEALNILLILNCGYWEGYRQVQNTKPSSFLKERSKEFLPKTTFS